MDPLTALTATTQNRHDYLWATKICNVTTATLRCNNNKTQSAAAEVTTPLATAEAAVTRTRANAFRCTLRGFLAPKLQ